MTKSGKRYNSKALKTLKVNLLVIAVACAYYAVLGLLGITCPIKAIFNFPCPVCGSTTAIICLLKGNIEGYFAAQPFSLPVLIAIALEINRFLFKKPVVIDVYAITIAVCNLTYYFIKIS